MRYIIGLLLGIGLIVLTFILIFKAFSGGSDDTTQQQKQAVRLEDYATTGAVVRYTIDGPVYADQDHSRVRVTVSKDQVLFEQIAGYEGKMVQTKTFPTNSESYATFLHALALQSFTSGNSQVTDDERGYCPTGRRYIYEVIDGADQVQRLWSTSCSSKQGSFTGGSAGTIRTLFQRQVPDWSKLTSGIKNL